MPVNMTVKARNGAIVYDSTGTRIPEDEFVTIPYSVELIFWKERLTYVPSRRFRCVLAVRVAVARRLRERDAEELAEHRRTGCRQGFVTRETSLYRRTPTRLTPPFALPPAL
jgi:hypothetical protein